MEYLDLKHLPGHSVVVDPPRVAAHRNSDRQRHIEERRREHHEQRFERTTTFTPIPKPVHSLPPRPPEVHYAPHPLAERAGRDSNAPRAPWIQRLLSLKFLMPTGTSNAIMAREAVRQRIERQKNLEPTNVNAVGGGSGPDGRVFGPPRRSSW